MIRKLHLCLHPDKDDATKVAKKISKMAKKYDMSIVYTPNEADCIITIGGDGTFLYGSRLALEYNATLAGINLGRFGFLPSFLPDDLDVLFEFLKRSEPSSRCVLNLEADFGSYHAINEVVIERKSFERAARVTMISSPPIYGTLQNDLLETDPNKRSDFLNKQMNDVIAEYSTYNDKKNQSTPGATFVCDGVIIATPLGSTAYSSSSGGPAISPFANVMSVTFTALHHPRIPPVVLTNNENVYMTVEEECVVVADGRHIGNISAGQVIRICIGNDAIKIFERPASVLSRLSRAFGVDRLA